MARQTTVMLVDDSSLMRAVMCRLLNADPELLVVATAASGQEAVDLVTEVDPDIVVMDVLMPHMSGLQATAAIMAAAPRPILLMSASKKELRDSRMFEAIALGALDIVEKPIVDGVGAPEATRAFVAKVKTLSTVRAAHRLLEGIRRARRPDSLAQAPEKQVEPSDGGAAVVVVLAASTGGPSALASVLASLPHDLEAAVLAVQHIAPGFDQSFVDWIARECVLEVCLATAGAPLTRGRVWVAPSDRHLVVDPDRRLVLQDRPPVDFQRPSANLLFSSAAAVFGSSTIGVVLSGMGADGTRGMGDIRRAGGYAIAQDEATSTVFGMPKAAIDAGVVHRVLPLHQIGRALAERSQMLAQVAGGRP
jgi:two-component system chemotaxis response regulator CheB